MKKFYESPIVEITVFDVEDVITKSIATAGKENIAEYITAVQNDLGQDTETSASDVHNFVSVYEW